MGNVRHPAKAAHRFRRPDRSRSCIQLHGVYGITLDGNSALGGSGNCFSTASTPTGPAAWNTQNKHIAPINAQKWGHIEEVMFSNCSADGIHVNAFNYMLMFDNFYAFNNGMYGVFTQGTNSGYTNFQLERNGTAGIHIAGSNNRFTSGEVIWNGSKNNTEAAVYVSGGRNIITAVETEDTITPTVFSILAPTTSLSDVHFPIQTATPGETPTRPLTSPAVLY